MSLINICAEKLLKKVQIGFEYQLGETFSDKLITLLNGQKLSNAEIYNKVSMSKSVFSDILQGKRLTTKNISTICIALRLSLEDSEDLLAQAGLAFSPCKITNVIFKDFIMRGDFDIDKINEILVNHGQKTTVECRD